MKTISLSASLLAIGALTVMASSAGAQSWTGSYIGGQISSGKVSDRTQNLTFDTNLDGRYGDTVRTSTNADYFAPGFCEGTAQGKTPAGGCTKDDNKGGGGLRIGYDWQRDHLVYGIVGEISSLEIRDSVSGFSSAPDSYTFTRKLKAVSALRGRLGYGTKHWLVYGTLGAAWADIDRTFSTSNSLNTFTASGGRGIEGGQGGFGLEKKIGNAWSVGLEYLHTSLRDKGTVIIAGASPSTFGSNPFLIANSTGTNMKRGDNHLRYDQVLLSVSYRFGAM